jgi:hypothetical protein
MAPAMQKATTDEEPSHRKKKPAIKNTSTKKKVKSLRKKKRITNEDEFKQQFELELRDAIQRVQYAKNLKPPEVDRAEVQRVLQQMMLDESLSHNTRGLKIGKNGGLKPGNFVFPTERDKLAQIQKEEEINTLQQQIRELEEALDIAVSENLDVELVQERKRQKATKIAQDTLDEIKREMEDKAIELILMEQELEKWNNKVVRTDQVSLFPKVR